MKTKDRKDFILVIFAIIATIYFGYTLFSYHYNDIENYSIYENNLGQFAFIGCCMMLIYRVLNYFEIERVFPFLLILLPIATILFYFIQKTFLPSFIYVFILSIFFFYTRKYLFYKKAVS